MSNFSLGFGEILTFEKEENKPQNQEKYDETKGVLSEIVHSSGNSRN